MLTVGARWSWRQNVTTQYAASIEMIHGLDALGSGLFALDVTTDPRRADFTMSRMTFTRLARIRDHWSLRVDAFGQQAAYALPYGERFKIGGDRLGRGFEVAEIAGDQGIGAKVELRRSLPSAPALLSNASVYGFYDAGAAFKQDLPGRESAATSGFGFATQSKRVTSMIEIAKPLTHPDVEGRKELSLFAEIGLAF
jgi:hemolysin activation/secretion protein